MSNSAEDRVQSEIQSDDQSENQSDSGVPETLVTVPDRSPLSSKSDVNEKAYDLNRMEDIFDLIRAGDDKETKRNLNDHVNKILEESGLCERHNFLFLIDNTNSIGRPHAERIYSAMQKFSSKKDIALIIRSPGGAAESAYLISRLCNKFKKNKFIAVIPAEAKSAATLLSFGADEIHMGPMSELGPIDVQVNGIPLLSVSSALTKIASIVEKHPKSAPMFAEYLTKKLDIGLIGHYDRVTESATQYAQLLLSGKLDDASGTVEGVASHFTNHYKDHSFVIDIEESRKMLGNKMVKGDTELYDVAYRIIQFINNVEFAYVLNGENKRVIFVGGGCEMMLESSDREEVLLRDIRGLC